MEQRLFTGTIVLQKQEATHMITNIEVFAGWGAERAAKLGEWTEKAMAQHKGYSVASVLVEDITEIVNAKPKEHTHD